MNYKSYSYFGFITYLKTAALQSTKDDEFMTVEEAKALLNTTKVTKVREMCLIAIGQAGLPDHINLIQHIIEQKFTNQTLDVRIAAVTALRRMKDMPNKVLLQNQGCSS